MTETGPTDWEKGYSGQQQDVGNEERTVAGQFNLRLYHTDPASGPTAGGTEVRLPGNALSKVVSVTFGSAEADFRVEGDSLIVATSPGGSEGEVVDVRAATDTDATDLGAAFTYTDTPE